MRIGLLSSLEWPVPPAVYGSWELVVANLASGLVARGHDVTVFASADSRPAGRLVSVAPAAIHVDGHVRADAPTWRRRHLERAFQQSRHLDVLHNHTAGLAVREVDRCPVPLVTTLHGSGVVPEDRAVYLEHRDLAYVSMSDAERQQCRELRFVATVHNGIEVERFPYAERGGDYLLYIGRMAPEKGVHDAIAAARAAGVRLVLAGVVHPGAAGYWDEIITPALRAGGVEYVGPVGHEEKCRLLADALGLVHLVVAEEAFGLTIAEAMACGTPVLGTRQGSIPELVVDGLTGVIVDDPADAGRAVLRLADCDRAACRRQAEERFSIQQMAHGYEQVYEKVLAELPPRARPA